MTAPDVEPRFVGVQPPAEESGPLPVAPSGDDEVPVLGAVDGREHAPAGGAPDIENRECPPDGAA
jgi:hypothetical protein